MGKSWSENKLMVSSRILLLLVPVLSLPKPKDVHVHLHGLDKVVARGSNKPRGGPGRPGQESESMPKSEKQKPENRQLLGMPGMGMGTGLGMPGMGMPGLGMGTGFNYGMGPGMGGLNPGLGGGMNMLPGLGGGLNNLGGGTGIMPGAGQNIVGGAQDCSGGAGRCVQSNTGKKK